MGKDAVASLVALDFAPFAIGTDIVGVVLALFLPRSTESADA